MTDEKKHPTLDLAFIENLPAPACAVDGNGKVILWNADMVALTGHAAATVLGKKAWNGLLPSRGNTPIDEALSSGEPVDGELTITRRDTGETVSVQIKAKPVFLAGQEDPWER